MSDRDRGQTPDERGPATGQPPTPPAPASTPLAPSAPPALPSATVGVDIGRRSFFRSFGREAVQAAAQFVGAAAALQRGPLAATGQLLGATGGSDPLSQLLGLDEPAPASGPVQLGPPYRYREGELTLVDQRRLPHERVEVTCNTGAEVAACVRDRMVAGGPVLGQVAAYGVLLAAERIRTNSQFVRIATLHGTINALRSARASSRPMAAALDRMVAAWQRVGEDAPGDDVVEVLRAETAAIEEEALLDHAAVGRAGAEILPTPTDRHLQVLLHGPVGTLGGGALGTALEVVQRLGVEGRDVHAWVPEGRPGLDGARLVAFELARLDVRHTVIADAAAAAVLARGRVDVVLVTAERIARNGDLSAAVGTYPLAAVAARHDVPFYVCAPLAAVDLEAADGWSFLEEERPVEELADLHGWRPAPLESALHNPVLDVTPGALVRGFITELGVLRPPFEGSLPDAVDRRARSGPVRSPSPGSTPAASGAAASPGAGGLPGGARPEAPAANDLPAAPQPALPGEHAAVAPPEPAPPAEDEDGWGGG